MSSNNPVYSSQGGVLFSKDQTTLVVYPGGANGSYTIPDGVSTIGIDAFASGMLSHVVISGGVTTIKDDAFFACTNLTTAEISGSLTNFGTGIFEECTALGSVTISNGVTSIGNGMFAICESLTNVTLPASVTTIGEAAFYECSSLTNIVIPDSVTNIGDEAFFSCTALTRVILPSGLTSIAAGTFSACTALASIIIPPSVTSLGFGAFENCSSLTAVYFEGAPPADTSAFSSDNIIAYYLPGTPGWGATFEGFPTALFPHPSILNFGIQTNAFSFTISGVANLPVIVDACTDLSNPDWQPIQTNLLTTGTAMFSDPQWASYSVRFYRLRSP